MKKLFYSFFALVAMSLMFVACGETTPEPDPEVESTCQLMQAYYTDLENGTYLYVFELISNELDAVNHIGIGDDIIIMMCAQPQENGAPVAKTYNTVNFQEWTQYYGEGVLTGVALSQTSFAGTFGYIVEDGQATDIIFCDNAEVKFEGNNAKGILTAKIKFASGTQEGVTYDKEYVFNGEFNVKPKQSAAPATRTIKYNM